MSKKIAKLLFILPRYLLNLLLCLSLLLKPTYFLEYCKELQNSHFLCHSAILRTRPQCKAKALIISHPCKSLQRFTATSRPNTSGCGHVPSLRLFLPPFLLHTLLPMLEISSQVQSFKSYISLDWGQYVLLAPLGFLLYWSMPLWPFIALTLYEWCN